MLITLDRMLDKINQNIIWKGFQRINTPDDDRLFKFIF
jgi:hypothetical protein